jgi:hypothetical protein
MRIIILLVAVLATVGCETTDVGTGDGDGNVTIIVQQCAEPSTQLPDAGTGGVGGASNATGVIDTCDDHLPCTVDVQCTPCSAVPEPIRFVKATCTPDNDLSPYCLDSMTGQLVYTGCTHFIQDPTPPGTVNSCFPVQFPDDPDSEVHAGRCNEFGICVENQSK